MEDIPCLESYVEFSCSKSAGCRSFETVVDNIINHGVRNVLSCSNHIRLKDINSIISSIHQQGKGGDYQFNIWFDEADKWLRGIESHITPLTEEFDNVKLNLITATPLRIIKKYKKLEVCELKNPTLPEYHGWLDSNFKIYPDLFKTEEFIERVLEENPEEIKKGTKWFIPGSASKIGHLLIKEYCKNKGFATIIINSEGIKIYMPDGKVEMEKRTDMPDRLMPMITRNTISQDFLWLSSLDTSVFPEELLSSSENFQITHAIMPASMRNKNEMSQIAGRTRNQKGWENYKPPLVFTTDKFHKTASVVGKEDYLSWKNSLSGRVD